MIGTRVGPYAITAKLGEGGMGEVWRATDTRLDREVAIKVLPAAFVADPERLARFEREAKLLAQLHHPHIASIFGLEESNGTRALVMELVEGEDLSSRIARGPIAIDDAIAIARQIAEALEAAHEKGIVHRDLKPQNVKLAADGTVKVLDFGLAKALDPTGGPASATDLGRSPTLMNSPTLTSARLAGSTQLGVILGTAAYMSPEQAKGGAVDKRADIWAFGVVLYEMLSGRSLFAGDSVAETLAGVLKSPIDAARLPPDTPAQIRQLVRRCLERDPRRRLHDIADARIVLDEVARGDGADLAASAPPPARRVARRELVAWAAALVGAVAALALLLRGSSTPDRPGSATASPLHFVVLPEEAGRLQGYPAISPDGSTMVYALQPDAGDVALWLHSFASGTAQKIAGTEGGSQPFWSPDGKHLGFFAAGKLLRLNLATGLAQPLAAVADARGGSWAADGEIYYSANATAAITQVSAASGPSRPTSELESDRGAESHRFPWALPGGGLLYTCTGHAEVSGVYWRGKGAAPGRRILTDVARVAYDGRGHLLWLRAGTLLAQPFDPTTGTLSGELTPLAQSVGTDQQATAMDWLAVGGNGVVALRTGSQARSELHWLDRRGAPLAVVATGARFREPTLSPDGRQVAVQKGDNEAQIWVYEAAATDQGRRLTFDTAQCETPAWSPDGRWIGYSSPRKGGWALLRKAADGSGEEEVLFESVVGSWIDSWAADGKTILFERGTQDRAVDLWLLPLDGRSPPAPWLETAANEAHSAISPDSSLIAYASDESGRSEVYVRTLAASGSRWQISRDGGDWPIWSADGSELFFAGLDRMLFAVPIRSFEPFAFDAPAALFRLRTPEPRITSNRTFYAPSPDGQRILVNQLIAAEGDSRIDVLMHWAPAPGDAPGAGLAAEAAAP